MLDVAAKFFNTLRISGWFHDPAAPLASLTLNGEATLAQTAELNLPHGGVASLGPDKGFTLQVLRPHEALSPAATLTFTTTAGWSATVPLAELIDERIAARPGHALMADFIARLEATPNARLLDIGGRDRSRLDRSAAFTRTEVTVLDILPGANVDIVADAHDLAALPAEHFDAVQSISVFEHLMMPWAVIPQIHRILKPGGLAFIATHQTLGMHDLPWDFWRFSDTAWDALFNRHTGFTIETRLLESEQFVVPFLITPIKAWAERALGYEASLVLARKTGPCTMHWPLTPADLTATSYPAGTEDPYERKS